MVPTIAWTAVAMPVALAPSASTVCYSADCVPNAARNLSEGAPCQPGKLFDYGLGPSGETFVCNKIGAWTPAGPLIGIDSVALPCSQQDASAQGADGVALVCADMGGGGLRWAHRNDTLE